MLLQLLIVATVDHVLLLYDKHIKQQKLLQNFSVPCEKILLGEQQWKRIFHQWKNKSYPWKHCALKFIQIFHIVEKILLLTFMIPNMFVCKHTCMGYVCNWMYSHMCVGLHTLQGLTTTLFIYTYIGQWTNVCVSIQTKYMASINVLLCTRVCTLTNMCVQFQICMANFVFLIHISSG